MKQNIDLYNKICDKLQSKIDNEELTFEAATEVNVAAFRKYVDPYFIYTETPTAAAALGQQASVPTTPVPTTPVPTTPVPTTPVQQTPVPTINKILKKSTVSKSDIAVSNNVANIEKKNAQDFVKQAMNDDRVVNGAKERIANDAKKAEEIRNLTDDFNRKKEEIKKSTVESVDNSAYDLINKRIDALSREIERNEKLQSKYAATNGKENDELCKQHDALCDKMTELLKDRDKIAHTTF